MPEAVIRVVPLQDRLTAGRQQIVALRNEVLAAGDERDDAATTGILRRIQNERNTGTANLCHVATSDVQELKAIDFRVALGFDVDELQQRQDRRDVAELIVWQRRLEAREGEGRALME